MVDQLLALLGRDEWQFERSVGVDKDGDVEEGKEAQPSVAGAAADRTLGLFSSNWPDRANVRGDRSLRSLLCDVGLIGAAAAAAPNSVKMSLSLLGGFSAASVSAMMKGWLIPGERRDSLLRAVRRVLLPGWARCMAL
jgi:hypothetical protein